MTLHVCAIETTPLTKFNGINGNSLMKSCKKFGIDLWIIGQGTEKFDLATKINIIQSHLKNLNGDDFILMLDFRDTIIFETGENIMKKFLEINAKILFGAEIFCYPASCIAKHFQENGHKSRFLNSGACIARVKDFRQFIDDAIVLKQKLANKNSYYMDLVKPSIDENGLLSMSGTYPGEDDQLIYQLLYITNEYDIKLDYENKIFQNLQLMSKWDDEKTTYFDVTYDYKNKKVKNRLYNTYPSVFHTPGNKKGVLGQLFKML